MWFLIVPFLCLLTTYLNIDSLVNLIQTPTSNPHLEPLFAQRKQLLLQRDALSPQDQYAKWTKLNRKLDKLDDEIATLKSSVKSNKSNLKSNIRNTLFGVYYLLKVIGGNSPVGYPSPNLFPPIIEKLVLKSDGAVGLFIWTTMISTVFGVIIKGIKSLKAIISMPKAQNESPIGN